MKSFTPRQKNPTKPVIKTKIVKIDSHTSIEVPADIPDEEARENYLLKASVPKNALFGFRKTSRVNYFKKEAGEEISQEELREFIDDNIEATEAE